MMYGIDPRLGARARVPRGHSSDVDELHVPAVRVLVECAAGLFHIPTVLEPRPREDVEVSQL